MRHFVAVAGAFALAAVLAAPALAEPTSARDVQAALDTYLQDGARETSLVGGPGSAGYDSGFWIRGGDFLLRANLTLQARYEWFDWDEVQPPEQGLSEFMIIGPTGGAKGPPNTFAGDLSGFSLPRATLKLSGEAPCNVSYYVELEFGHYGRDAVERAFGPNFEFNEVPNLGPGIPWLVDSGFLVGESTNFDNTREAWIQWSLCPEFNVRMGQVGLPTTRQLMVKPELQQFADISLASAFVGQILPGYTDRPRDHGLLFHGAFGCNKEFSYMVSVTNGDGGDSIRNVLDHRTSDNLAYGARLNWAFLKPIGYQEGALRHDTCSWYGEVGAWGFYYADRFDKPHTTIADSWRAGVDLALGYAGFSFTGAYNIGSDEDHIFAVALMGDDIDYTAWLAQLGFHIPGTAWEVAARASSYTIEVGAAEATTIEYAFAVNYYLNGHGNKMTLDVAFIEGQDEGSVLIYDPYAGYPGFALGDETFGMLLRFQWQLAL